MDLSLEFAWADLTAIFGLVSWCRRTPDVRRCTKSACENEPEANLSDCLAGKLCVTACQVGRQFCLKVVDISLAFVALPYCRVHVADVPTVV